MKTIKKLLGWAILWAVAIFAINYVLANFHHVLVFGLVVGTGVFLYVKLTSKKVSPTTKRLKRFLAQKLSK